MTINQMSIKVANTKWLIGEAFKELRRAGYVCRSAFMCCGTCASYAIGQTAQYKKTGKAVFYHRQDASNLARSNSVYLGWEGDGEEIVAAMRKVGLIVEWPGDPYKRILVGGPEPIEEPKAAVAPSPEPVAEKPKAEESAPFEIGTKPAVKLTNTDGNAFSILGQCQEAARRAGKPKSWIDHFRAEAIAGDYNYLLRIACRYFEVS